MDTVLKLFDNCMSFGFVLETYSVPINFFFKKLKFQLVFPRFFFFWGGGGVECVCEGAGRLG